MNAGSGVFKDVHILHPKARTGIFRRNARKVEREMILQTGMAYAIRDRIPVALSLLTVIKRLSSVIAGL